MEFVLSGFIRTFVMLQLHTASQECDRFRDERKYNNSRNQFMCLYDVCGCSKL
nr:MAG TPA: hypothetical protein [Caudoviricetes sp.]